MIPAIIISKVVPKVLDMVLKQFKGIEKIPYLVKYMEEENEVDKGIKQLADEIDTTNNKIDNLNDVVVGLKKQLKELQDGNK